MARRKVAPTQITRRPERQGSLPKGREQQSSRKRGQKKALPVELRAAPSSTRRTGQRATSILDEAKARTGTRGTPSRGAKRTKHRRGARTPSIG